MPIKTRAVELSNDQLRSLTTLLRSGTTDARTLSRAHTLDLLHRGYHPDEIARTLRLSTATVYNIKRRFLEEGLEAALVDRPRSGKPPRIDGTQRAKITALACSQAPAGHARWSLRLLADKAIELGFVDTISHNAVKEILKKTTSSRT
jgi:putative transposase